VELRCRVAITPRGGAGSEVWGNLVEPCAVSATTDGGVGTPAIELRTIRFSAQLRWHETVAATAPDVSMTGPPTPCP